MDSVGDYRLVGLIPLATFLALSLSAFIYCYYGDRITRKPTHFIESVYDTPWYLLPAKHQRAIYTMIIYGQQEITYSGYGIIGCSLETFGQVISISFIVH